MYNIIYNYIGTCIAPAFQSFQKHGNCNGSPKVLAVLKHYNVLATIRDEDFKTKCMYCKKEIIGSVKATTNWWKHLVSNSACMNNLADTTCFVIEMSSFTNFEERKV